MAKVASFIQYPLRGEAHITAPGEEMSSNPERKLTAWARIRNTAPIMTVILPENLIACRIFAGRILGGLLDVTRV